MPVPNVPTSAYTDADGSVYVQALNGSETHFIGGCFEAGDLPNPQGDVDPIWCLDGDRVFQIIGETKTPPGKITSTVTGLTENSSNWMEIFVGDFCPFFLHFVQHTCGTRGTWGHWERVYTYYIQAVTDDVISGFLSREGGNPTTHAFNWTAFPPRVSSRRLGIGRKTTTETLAANCIWAEPKMCGSSCGDDIKLGQNLMVGCDGDAGNEGNILRSTDFGQTWTAAATPPHANDEDTMAGVAFPIDKDTMRHVSFRGASTPAGVALECQYSDDYFATAATNVVIGATVNEAVQPGGQGAFAFDQEHIWVCTGDGNVYFSDDGVATWTDQNALAASAGGALNSIHFYDANVGVAAGVGPVVIYTIDGGTNWAAMANNPGGVPQSIRMTGPSSNDVISGDTGGDVDRTRDLGVTAWAEQFGTFTDIQSLDIAARSVYFLIDNDATAVDKIHQTVDGGVTFQAYTTPTNTGLNQILALSPTLAFAVGEVTGGTATIIRLGVGAI